MYKYSVIVPVYNREQTLERCLESLIKRNRNDIQILVIDDGSTDSSARIALDFAKEYPEVRYCYQQNTGVSAARNHGLDLAEGTYVTFVDSDDCVTDDYFDVLDRAEAYDSWDLLIFAKQGLCGIVPDETALLERGRKLASSGEKLELLLSSRLIMQPVTKCFRKEIIQANHLRFVEGLHIGEDFTFCMAYALQCPQIKIVSTPIYCVDVSDQNSLSRKYRPHLDEQMVRVFGYVSEAIRNSRQYQQNQQQLLAVADYLFVKNVCSSIAEEFKAGKVGYLRYRQEIVTICRRFRQPLCDQYCGLVHRLMRQMLKWNWYLPFYAVSLAVKGRSNLPCREG